MIEKTDRRKGARDEQEVVKVTMEEWVIRTEQRLQSDPVQQVNGHSAGEK
jgi:hypothetical protein